MAISLLASAALLTGCGPQGGQGGGGEYKDSNTGSGSGQIYDRGGAAGDASSTSQDTSSNISNTAYPDLGTGNGGANSSSSSH